MSQEEKEAWVKNKREKQKQFDLANPEIAEKKKLARAKRAKEYRKKNSAKINQKNKEYRKSRPDWVKASSKKHGSIRRKKLTEWYRNYKSTLVCARCGFSNPAALQFHHRDPKTKEFSISQKLKIYKSSLEAIMKEIEKCEVLCANCHMIEHHQERYLSNA